MTLDALLAGIRDADLHVGGIRCARLFRVAPAYLAELRDDVERLCRSQLPSDATRPDHVTHWTLPFGEVTQFSLLNASGRFDDFSRDHDLSCRAKRFHRRGEYTALARFVDAFPCAVNFRVNVLGPRSGLSPHEEHVLFRTRAGTVGARLRFHLPVVTNPLAELTLEGEVHHLGSGEIWFVHNGCVHAARNRGDRPRIHLVWDMLLTREVFELMLGSDVPSVPLDRVAPDERSPAPIRTERVGVYRRLSPMVAPEQARALGLCEPQ